MDIQALVERKAELLQKARAIRDGAKARDQELTDDETQRIDALLDESEDIDAKITRAQADSDRDGRLDGALDALNQPEPRQTTPDARRTNGDGSKPPHITNQRDLIRDDPKKGFTSPREFVLAVMAEGQSGRYCRDAKHDGLRVLAAAGSDEQGTYSDPYGGFLVPEGFSPDMLRLEPEADPMAGRTMMIPMSTPTIKIPSRVDKDHSSSVSGGLTVTRRMETGAATSSRMETEKIALTAYSLFGLAYVTEELLTDSPISFAALLASGFSDEFTSHMIDERINGTGSGEHMGILTSDCLVTIAKETSQAASTIKYENVIKMRAQVWRYSSAIWLANHDTIPQLMQMDKKVGTGGAPVWQPSAREDHPDLLLGRPIIFTEYAKTLGTKGDIICANWSEYLEGVLQPLQSAESIHVRFVNHERTFKFWLRNAGAPWWRSALTPKNSSSTLSPFVVLATRS